MEENHLKHSLIFLPVFITRIILLFLAIFSAAATLTIYVHAFATNTLFQPDYFDIGLSRNKELILLPFFYTGVTLGFLYLMFKLKNRSRESLFLSIGGLLGLPLLTRLFTNILYPNLYSESFIYNIIRDTSFHTIGTSLSGANPYLLGMIFLGILFLAISYKTFKQANSSLSKRYKLLFIGITILSFGINIFLLGTIIYKTSTTDYGYKTVQSQVNYKVYRPGYIPDNRDYSQPMRVEQSSDGLRDQAVVMVFAQVITMRGEIPQTPHMISVSQAGVKEGFDYDAHLQDIKIIESNTTSQRDIDISISKNGKGRLTEYTNLNYKPFSLELMSKENTLILIFSTDLPLDELVKFTESLQ